MRQTLSSRIQQLESKVSTPQPEPLSKQEREQRDAKLIRILNTSGYSDWRHDGLSLEQLLALARDDSTHALASPRASWSPGFRQDAPGAWVTFWPAVSAREFEIQILERDVKIDAETAESLRKNLHSHFFAPDDSAAVQREPLAKLPHPIEFDEAAALNAARLQCPHFDSLALEEQIEYLEEDLLKARQDAAATRQHAAALRVSGGSGWVTAKVIASLAEDGVLKFEQRIAKLKERIVERGSAPLQKDTSATA